MLAEIEGEQELWAAQYNEKFTLPDAVYEKVCTEASKHANTRTDKPTNIHKHTRKRTHTHTHTHTYLVCTRTRPHSENKNFTSSAKHIYYITLRRTCLQIKQGSCQHLEVWPSLVMSRSIDLP